MKVKLGDFGLPRECLDFGHDVARLECGIAVAQKILKNPKPRSMTMVMAGVLTALAEADRLAARNPTLKDLTRKIAKAAKETAEDLKGSSSTESISKAKDRLDMMTKLTIEIFARGKERCKA